MSTTLQTARATGLRKKAKAKSVVTGGSFNVVAVVGLVLTIGAAFLYAIDSAHSIAYYQVYGLQRGFFEVSWNVSLYSGSIGALRVGALAVIGFFGAAAIYWVTGVGIEWARGTNVGQSTNRFTRWLVSFIKRIPTNKDFNLLALVGLLAGGILLWFGGIYLLVLSHVEDLGENRAKREIEVIRTNNIKKMQVENLVRVSVAYLDGTITKTEEGISITCQHNTMCAIRKSDRTVVLPARNIVRIETLPFEPAADVKESGVKA